MAPGEAGEASEASEETAEAAGVVSNYGHDHSNREYAAEDRNTNPRKRPHGTCFNCHSDRHQIKDCPSMTKRK